MITREKLQILGYTEEEIDEFFSEDRPNKFDGYTEEEIKDYYEQEEFERKWDMGELNTHSI